MDTMDNKKRIFKMLHVAIGLAPKVVAYYDADKKSKIDIYIGADRPDFGITTYSTIGLSEHRIGLTNASDEDIRVEFISICNSSVSDFANVLATCAFNILNDNYSCRPGTVYPDILNEYYDGLEMEHIYFTTPFLWDNLESIKTDNKIVVWLMAIPVSSNELDYLKENGADALEDLFEKSNIDVFDIGRKSVV